MVKENKEQVFLSFVLYVHNNAGEIKDALQKIWDLGQSRFEKFEIIIVNDASTDQTEEKVKAFCEGLDTQAITFITLSKKHGLEASILAGVDFSIGDYVVEIDNINIDYDVDIFYQLYEKSCKGFDIVSLQPKRPQRVTSRMFYYLLSRFSDFHIEPKTQIAHILTRRAINAISTIKDKTRYRKILHVFCGLPSETLDIALTKKISSTYSLNEKIKMGSDILFSFTRLGVSINIYIALLFFTFSLLLGGYTVYQYLTYSSVVKGWTTTMMFLSVGFSGIFMVLAIINKYFAIMLKEIRTFPHHTIKTIEKL